MARRRTRSCQAARCAAPRALPGGAAGLSIALLALCASPFRDCARAADERPSRPGLLAEIGFDVRSASPIESYMLAPELNFLRPDRPRIHVWPVVARGRDLDSSQVSALADILDATRIGARGATGRHCSFVPAYALRLRGQRQALDILLPPDCRRWYFLYGEEDIGEYKPRAQAAADSLRVLVRGLFVPPPETSETSDTAP